MAERLSSRSFSKVVLKAVLERGAVGLDELESAIPADVDDGFWMALDAAVDHGYLRLVGWQRGGKGCYRLTQRGRRALEASSASSAAA